ncbi:MAG: S-formylglutathione hydrolase [Pseudomonadota bacterium]
MTLTLVSENTCFGGTQRVYSHPSAATGTQMTFGLFLPPQAELGPVPLLIYLSGLTCTHENVMTKAGAQHWCAEHGLAFLMPDTSPRGEDVPDGESYDFGQGAGFYVDATEPPWSQHFKMESYILKDLMDAVSSEIPQIDMTRKSITGHSMGGHGALTLALKNPDMFKSVSAFSPIVSPISCPWGQKALTGYLGSDEAVWRRYDSCALIKDGARMPDILVDQGTADQFLEDELKSHLLADACAKAAIPLTLNMRNGYDHSYFFIQSFMADHVVWAAERLT